MATAFSPSLSPWAGFRQNASPSDASPPPTAEEDELRASARNVYAELAQELHNTVGHGASGAADMVVAARQLAVLANDAVPFGHSWPPLAAPPPAAPQRPHEDSVRTDATDAEELAEVKLAVPDRTQHRPLSPPKDSVGKAPWMLRGSAKGVARPSPSTQAAEAGGYDADIDGTAQSTFLSTPPWLSTTALKRPEPRRAEGV